MSTAIDVRSGGPCADALGTALGADASRQIEKRLATLDNSARELFAQCPQKFWYRYGLLLAPESDGESWPLTFGAAIHKGLECHDLDLALVAFHAAYDEAGHGPTPEQVEQVRAEPYANQQKAHTHAPDRGDLMLTGYFELFPPSKARWGHLDSELQLSAEIAPGQAYYGTIDKKLIWKIGDGQEGHEGRPFPLDHKTTGNQRGSAGLITNPHNQMLGYLWLLLVHDPEERPLDNGLFAIDSDEQFDYIIDVLIKDQTIKGKKYLDGSAYDRVHERVGYWQILRWRDEMLTVYDDIQRCHERGIWRRETRSCFDFFSPCPCLGLCRAENPEPAELGYVETPWGPAFDA